MCIYRITNLDWGNGELQLHMGRGVGDVGAKAGNPAWQNTLGFYVLFRISFLTIFDVLDFVYSVLVFVFVARLDGGVAFDAFDFFSFKFLFYFIFFILLILIGHEKTHWMRLKADAAWLTAIIRRYCCCWLSVVAVVVFVVVGWQLLQIYSRFRCYQWNVQRACSCIHSGLEIKL